MNPKRYYYLLLSLMILSIAMLFGATYGVRVLMQSQATKLSALKLQLPTLQTEQSNLTVAKKEITKYTDIYNITKVIVPQNKDQAQSVRQIVNLAAANNVNLASITFPNSSLGNAAVHPGTPAPAAVSPTAGSNPNLSQLTVVPSIPGVYELPITVLGSTKAGQETTYPELIGFLQALENNRQTASISSIDITPDSNNNGYFSFILQLDIYIKPGK